MTQELKDKMRADAQDSFNKTRDIKVLNGDSKRIRSLQKQHSCGSLESSVKSTERTVFLIILILWIISNFKHA